MSSIRKINFKTVGKNTYSAITLPLEFTKYCVKNGFDIVLCVFEDGKIKLMPHNSERISDEICYGE